MCFDDGFLMAVSCEILFSMRYFLRHNSAFNVAYGGSLTEDLSSEEAADSDKPMGIRKDSLKRAVPTTTIVSKPRQSDSGNEKRNIQRTLNEGGVGEGKEQQDGSIDDPPTLPREPDFDELTKRFERLKRGGR